MKIEAIALLQDNYAWLLTDPSWGDTCAVIDPSEGAPVGRLLEKRGLRLRWILATHHHWDHVGGIEWLVAHAEGPLDVICSAYDAERIPGATRLINDGDSLNLDGQLAQCLLVPGHTLGAVAYYFAAAEAVFTGDTLFTAGCGRLFEGTPQQMHASLQRLATLPPATWVYCGHEYTEKNLSFAATVEADSVAIRERLAMVRSLRARGEATVPAMMLEELATNPFLRASEPGLAHVAEGATPVEVFAALRERRNHF